ncbi:MAG: hypothetical protein IJW82_00675, partial [Clostridia bacterium]|nr:hypothetical protein [Clostridia bacterium]
TNFSSSASSVCQDDNGYSTSTVYWFKYEPITWTIKEESNGYASIVCNMILDSQDFNYIDNSRTINGSTVYASNYEYSHIRSWLNDTFYNTAFNNLEKAIIQTTLVDNSASSTSSSSNSYACNNTNDKIYLLSYQEVTTYFTSNSERQKKGTDYAKCQGLFVNTSSEYYGNSVWWLRSPYNNYSYRSFNVFIGGGINGSDVDFTIRGVLPALKIKLDSSENETLVYTRNEDTITFGSYPQSKITTSSLITELTNKAGSLPTSSNSYFWTDSGYYIENNIESYMWYIDLEYNSDKYRGVYFTSYRSRNVNAISMESNSNQDDNGYSTSTVYWFKYEPISWTIKEESNGYATIVCDMILDSQDFNYADSSRTLNGKTIYGNNYEYSHIRQWLNDTFYNTAFNKLEQELIQISTVDNSLSSTGDSENEYICNDTNDKIYLLSYKEATTYFENNSQRQKQSSDYAKCQGLSVSTDSNYLGNGYWWLRSPSCSKDYNVINIYSDGAIKEFTTYATSYGVVPVLKIKL